MKAVQFVRMFSYACRRKIIHVGSVSRQGSWSCGGDCHGSRTHKMAFVRAFFFKKELLLKIPEQVLDVSGCREGHRLIIRPFIVNTKEVSSKLSP